MIFHAASRSRQVRRTLSPRSPRPPRCPPHRPAHIRSANLADADIAVGHPRESAEVPNIDSSPSELSASYSDVEVSTSNLGSASTTLSDSASAASFGMLSSPSSRAISCEVVRLASLGISAQNSILPPEYGNTTPDTIVIVDDAHRAGAVHEILGSSR